MQPMPPRSPVRTQHAEADLREVLHGSIEALKGRLRDRGVSLSLRVPGEPIVVSVDRPGIERLVAEIADLACRTLDRGGTLKVLARTDAGKAVVNFMDIEGEAMGAPEESCGLARLFGGASASRAADAGSRIARCERIVDGHDGRLYAAPSPLGGLGLTLRLPLRSGCTA